MEDEFLWQIAEAVSNSRFGVPLAVMTEGTRRKLFDEVSETLVIARRAIEDNLCEQLSEKIDAIEPLSEPPCGSVHSSYRNGYSDGVDAAVAVVRYWRKQ